MGGISIEHGKDRVPCPIMNPPNLCTSKNAGTITMTSLVSTTPHDVEPQPYSLTAGCLGLGYMGNATIGGYRIRCPFQKS